MESRKNLRISQTESCERECIFFSVEYNHFRDVSGSSAHDVTDREDMAQCECVLCLPDTYKDTGEKTQLILFCHGAGSRVSEHDSKIGGLGYVPELLDAGYAIMDVCGSEIHGTTMGCPEHIFAMYKAYRYAVSKYNFYDRVLLAGASMGGHTAMNFANIFPSLVLAVGMFYPRLNMDGVYVGDHYCIGTWDKNISKNGQPSTKERIREIYRFPGDTWCEENTVGFNPYRTRSFVDTNGERVVIPPCPIKIWQGTEDKTVDPILVREFVDSVRRSGSYIELHMLEGATHKISQVMRDEIVMWFNRFV